MPSVLRLSVAGLLLALASFLGAREARQVVNINRDWRFLLGDRQGAEAPAFDDGNWERIGLPHSFSLPYFAADRFYVGYGWYRKRLEIPTEWTGRRLFLDFEGAFQDAEIFLNGKKVGSHKGGYTGFEIEITGAARPGTNTLAVRLNNLWNPRLAPRAGEHVFSGGLYRNVWLVSTAQLHVAWYGTFVTTPELSSVSGKVNVKTEVSNQAAEAKDCGLRTEVFAPDGTLVASLFARRRIGPGETCIFEQTSEDLRAPELWSPSNPLLYSVKSTVLDGDKPVDDYVTPFGFRWFEFTANRGFFLNGERRYFRGANVHQDHAGWGDAVADSGFYRDIGLVKKAGFDFVRGSHYPHAPAFSRACDELGMLFWSENCFWGTGGFDSPWAASAYPTNPADEAEFEESVKAGLRDMIRIHRNHPSIVVWSMTNEVFFSDRSVLPKVRKFLKSLVAYSHEQDPTRPAAIGGSQRGELDKLGDLAGYNGDGARLFPNPGIPNVVSEYGSTIADRPGKYAPGWGDLPNTPGADKKVPYSWRLPWRSGEILWCAFDHGSLAGRRFGSMGFVDYFRLPKRQWYWYRNEYLGIAPPVWPSVGAPAALRLSADKTTLLAVDGTDDAQVVVEVLDGDGKPLSNCPPVTLAVEDGPGEFPTGPSIVFGPDSDIAIRDGSAAIEFRSYYAGETVLRATSPGLRDATLRIVSLGEPRYIPGKTPPTAPRPYVRFVERRETEDRVRDFGLENPTRASSEEPGHGGRLANDGNPETHWLARSDDKAPWLTIDLERIVTVARLRVLFPSEGSWGSRVELSEDGERHWQTLAERSPDDPPAKTFSASFSGEPKSGRFLRITITAWPSGLPGLAEASVTGTLENR